jgi:NAD(P)-dependent dehydrogenase (short-subunit alcohol dehydrogenase family)
LNVKAREIPEADFDRTLKVNLFGTNNMITKLEPLLDNGASIVNISSIYASRSPDFNIYDGNEELYSNISYGISKAGIEQMTRYYARLYGPRIRVNAIAPGGIYQGHSDDFVSKYARMVPLQRMANVEEIVNSILFLLSPLSSYINGHVLKVDGGLNA